MCDFAIMALNDTGKRPLSVTVSSLLFRRVSFFSVSHPSFIDTCLKNLQNIIKQMRTIAQPKEQKMAKKKTDHEKTIETLEGIKEQYTTAEQGDANSVVCGKIKSLLSACQQHVGKVTPKKEK